MLQDIDAVLVDIYSHGFGNRHATCYVYFPRKAMNTAFLMATPTYNQSR